MLYNIRAIIWLNIAIGLFRLRPRSVNKIASLFLIRRARVTRKINKIKQIREHRATHTQYGMRTPIVRLVTIGVEIDDTHNYHKDFDKGMSKYL